MNRGQILKEEICNQFPGLREEKLKILNVWKKYNEEGAGKKICIFGMGLMGRSCLKYLNSMGIQVDLCVDNDPEKHSEKESEEYPKVCAPGILETYCSNVFCIVAAGNQVHEEIIMQLKKYGVEDVWIDNHMDFILEAMMILTQFDLFELQERIFQCIDLFDEESLMVLMKHFEECFGMQFSDAVEWNILNNEMQYFLADGNFLNMNESIVECGSFIGDSIEKLIATCGVSVFDKINKYFCYELNVDNFRQLKKSMDVLPELKKKIITINKGIGRKAGVCYYTTQANCTKAVEKGQYSATIVCLDDEFVSTKVTMIKMDIEGSEMDAIWGGAKVLKRDLPKCAICTYHSVHELWEIPLLLHSIVPEYKLFLRHHSDMWQETVCYAYIEKEEFLLK